MSRRWTGARHGFPSLTQASFAPHFLIDCFSIILIDLLLAGDNALVIAMVVRGLPRRQRRTAIVFGAALAVLLRIAITFGAAQLLRMEFTRLAGGALIVWVAVKVLVDAGSGESEARVPAHLLQAICWIVLADITMSLDNILAVAGASKGNLGLIVFGLSLSIPFVIFSSRLLSLLMDRYPAIVYLGAAILGKVGAEMILTDPFTVQRVHPSDALRYTAEGLLALGVVAAGRLLSRRAASESAST
jgi:YjbE family integral membrane protein